MNDLYFYAKDGYNKIEIKGKSIIYMRTADSPVGASWKS